MLLASPARPASGEGWGPVVFFQLLTTVIGLGIEQLLNWHYGSMGVFALVLLSIGIRTRDKTCLSVSAVIFLLLMAQA